MRSMPLRNRPKNLNLLTIRLPINAVVSIMHRVSGMVLFLLLPLGLWILQRSLSNQADYVQIVETFDFWFAKVVIIALLWPFFHHFYAGLRHLAQDLHWMHGLHQASQSSRALIALDFLSVMLVAYWIW